MAFVKESLSDADLVLMMTDVFEDPREFPDQEIFAQMRMSKRSVSPAPHASLPACSALHSRPRQWVPKCLSRAACWLCRPLLLAVNKVDVFPNATNKAGKLGKEMLAKVRRP